MKTRHITIETNSETTIIPEDSETNIQKTESTFGIVGLDQFSEEEVAQLCHMFKRMVDKVPSNCIRLAITGPLASGKTTLLQTIQRVLAGALIKTSEDTIYDGEAILVDCSDTNLLHNKLGIC